MNEDRLEKIETRLAYQEKTIKDLNDVVYEQQKQIDKLASTCEMLMDLVRKNAGSDAPANEKPPHY
jgi:SlyX protein